MCRVAPALSLRDVFIHLVFRHFERPIDEERASDEVGARHESPVAAVVAVGPVVSHHEVVAGRNDEVFALDVSWEGRRTRWQGLRVPDWQGEQGSRRCRDRSWLRWAWRHMAPVMQCRFDRRYHGEGGCDHREVRWPA